MTPASATTAALASATQAATGGEGTIVPFGGSNPGMRPWERTGSTVNGLASTSYSGSAYGSGLPYSRPYSAGYGGYGGGGYGSGYGGGMYGGGMYGGGYGSYGSHGSYGGYGGYGGGYSRWRLLLTGGAHTPTHPAMPHPWRGLHS